MEKKIQIKTKKKKKLKVKMIKRIVQGMKKNQNKKWMKLIAKN